MKQINSKQFTIFLIIFLLAIFSVSIIKSGLIKKSCKNQSCFDKTLKKCIPSYFYHTKQDNTLKYTIHGSFKNNCIITIKMEKVKPDAKKYIKDLFKEKEMKCTFPKNLTLTTKTLTENIDFCEGPLKEAMYKFIAENLYGSILKNIANITHKIS